MKVYVVETGDYEQRGVMLIAASLEVAIREIKKEYVNYEAIWNDPVAGQWWTSIEGAFRRRSDGYSFKAKFDIEEYEVLQ